MKRKQWFCLDCRVDMKYDAEFDFFCCPICGAEAHFPQDDKPKDEIIKLMGDMAPTHRQTEVKPMGAIVPGGGSKTSGVKKPKSKKLSLSALNNQLYHNY